MSILIHKNVCILFFILFFGAFSFAQTGHTGPRSIHPMTIDVTTSQTSVMVFPAAIKSVDRGSKGILTKTVKEVDNVLKIKAASDTMHQTNLHVFTADGTIYPFEVRYHPLPPHLTIDLTGGSDKNPFGPLLQFSANRLNDAMVAQGTTLVSLLPPIRHRPGSRYKGGMRLQSTGTYLSKGVLFLPFRIVNTSAVPYPIDFIRIYIRDKRRSKRTSVTETEIQPLHISAVTQNTIAAHTSRSIALAFNQFTIADNKQLVIELFEQNGDRSLTCKLRGKDLLRARTLTLPESPPAGLSSPE